MLINKIKITNVFDMSLTLIKKYLKNWNNNYCLIFLKLYLLRNVTNNYFKIWINYFFVYKLNINLVINFFYILLFMSNYN